MSTPPDRLPVGFRNVWQAVRDADQRAPSRRVLARELGVSSFTLHRLLVSGEVPDLREASIREQRAWVRTLARIAHRLRAPARAWIEEAGVVWTPATERLVTTVAGRELRTEDQPHSGTPGWWRSLEPLRTLDVGVGRLPGPGTGPRTRLGPGSGPGLGPGPGTPAGRTSTTDDRDSFLGALARRLLRALAPETRVRFHSESPSRISAGILDGRLDLAVGAWDTARTRRAGAHTIPVPGLTVPLRAFAATPRRESWSSLVASATSRFVVEPGAPAGDYLRVHCGVRPGHIFEHDGVASDASTAVDVLRGTGSILVVDAWSAWHLERSRASEPLEEIYGLAEEDALVRLAVAVPADAEALAGAVAYLLEYEFLAANPRRTAELYALLLEAPLSDLADPQRAHLHRSAQSLRLSSLPAHADRMLLRTAELVGSPAWLLFPKDACERMAVHQLEITTPVVDKKRRTPSVSAADPASEALEPRNGATETDATTLVVDPAPNAQPVATVGTEASGRSASDVICKTPLPGRCQSCSEPLSRSGGVSPHYCRYCSSEDGDLRPLPEVQSILRHWMLTWQSGVTEENVDERVRYFMKSMPAWAGRV